MQEENQPGVRKPAPKYLIVVVILSIFIGTGLLIYSYSLLNKPGEKTAVQTPSASVKPTEVSASPSATAVALVSDAGVKWLSKPVKLDDLDLFVKSDDTMIGSVDYYQAATLDNGGEIIIAEVSYDGPGGASIFRFKKDKNNKYWYLLKHSAEKDYAKAEQLIDVNKALVDSTTVYKSLSAPAFLDIKNTNLQSGSYEGLAANLKDTKEIAQTQYGKIYQTFSLSTGDYAAELNGTMLNLVLQDSSYIQYSVKPDFAADDGVIDATWSSGSKVEGSFTLEGYVGCAMSANYNVIINTKNVSSRLTEAGKTKDNEKIYTLAKDDAIIKAAYENYKAGREDILSLADFWAKKPVFVWKDGFDEYVIFTNKDFGGLAECGKPVIYLYPVQPTNVSVKVGAQITKSEPVYDNGWNVLANPSGLLKLDGKNYDYLFWEGIGQQYPEIKEGQVVKKENVKSTLENNLKDLGLNAKESADFMEFWLPKMPDSKFVRLTWFGTREMNQLAPLSVNPKPDTIIRVFLDFQGMDQFVNLTAQKLSAPERKGFTLIEWGGLLRGEK